MSTAGDTNTPTPRKSLDEIAAMMAENTAKMRGVPQEPTEPNAEPNEVSDEPPVELETDAQEASSEEVAEETPEEATEEVTDAGDERDEEVESSGEDAGEFEITEDTLFAISDDTEVTFKELRDNYKADSEKARLLDEQRTATQEAYATRQQAVEDGTKARQAAEAVFGHFQQIIATPNASLPDESLKTTNPAEYIQRLEYFQQDQQRIQAQQQDLAKVFDLHLQQQQETKDKLRDQVIHKLTEVVPALKSSDPQVKLQAGNDIKTAAEYYGFSPEEVNEAVDHRVYQMAYDAQQYRKILKKSSTVETKEEKKTKVRNQTRTLRPRGTQATQRLNAQAKRVKLAKATAKKSGKVNDVADLIAAKRR